MVVVVVVVVCVCVCVCLCVCLCVCSVLFCTLQCQILTAEATKKKRFEALAKLRSFLQLKHL